MNPTSSHADTRSSSVESEADLRALFRAAAPATPPMDVDALLARAVLGQRQHTAGRARWALIGLAAGLLVLVGAGIGWQGARRVASGDEARANAALAAMQERIVTDVTRALRDTEQVMADAHEDGMKRVALLLRDDYRRRIAELEVEVQRLALAVNVADVRSAGNWQ